MTPMFQNTSVMCLSVDKKGDHPKSTSPSHLIPIYLVDLFCIFLHIS
jgi:hypothetical protein